jgi:hypothetical protein
MPADKPTDATTAEEMAKQQAEPLLPAEKWLIFGSITLGLVLLGLLLWLTGAV